MEDVWVNGGRSLCSLIQDRTKVLSVNQTVTMYSAQHLAVTQLALPTVFTYSDLMEPQFNPILEKKLIKFLKNLKNALSILEKMGNSDYRINEDIIARGVGLYAAYVGRRAVFSIYSKCNESFEGIIVEMNGAFGEPALLVIGGNYMDGDIRIEYKIKRNKVLVSYIVSAVGHYHLKISKDGRFVPGSPFEIHAEEAPIGYNGKFGASEWYESDVKELPKISGIFDNNSEKLKINKRDINELSLVPLKVIKQPMITDNQSPIKKALSLKVSPKFVRREKYAENKGIISVSSTAHSLILARRFTSKLRTPFEINLQNFHYFDNVDGLPSDNESKINSDSIEFNIDSLESEDKFILKQFPNDKLQTSSNLKVDEAYKKDEQCVEVETFNVWPSMTMFGPPHKSNPISNPISSNNLPTSPRAHPSTNTTTRRTTTTTTTYLSPDGAAFPISFNQNEISFDRSYKTALETNQSPNNSLINNLNNVIIPLPNVNSNFESFSSEKSEEINKIAILINDNSISLPEKSESSDKTDSSSSEDNYKMPKKERIIEVALKAEYECTVFVPKSPEKENVDNNLNEKPELIPNNNSEHSVSEVSDIKSKPKSFPKTLSLKNNIRGKDNDNMKKLNVKSKRRFSSFASDLDLKRSPKHKENLRRTQSALSKSNSKSMSTAFSYFKSRKQVFISFGEYTKGTEVIKSSKSVKKWKNYWDGLQYEKNVYTMRAKSCSLELDGIVAKGKFLFENISHVEKSQKTITPSKLKPEVYLSVKSVENSLDIPEEDPERKKRFEKARNMFATLEKSSKRMYRSLPSKFKKNQHEERRRRINSESFTSVGTLSERFHVTDLYKDLHEGLGAPGIPHRLAVLASLRSVEPQEDVEIPGYSAYYPHLPTTPQNKYVHRSNIESLIPWGQIVKVN
ncbi:hypothetical protein O3M35_010665 [Rhynocoris fuscipes]|uniref:Uncharacterized protein n=1 Tax=Rhynocoris fuscipes TaxID=488301 RepID=A0AAW1D7G8_9HEMI